MCRQRSPARWPTRTGAARTSGPIAALLLACAAASQQDPQQDRQWVLRCELGPDPVSTDGTFQLKWALADAHGAAAGGEADGEVFVDLAFQLEERLDDDDPVVLDVGPHRSAALSGRDDGVYRYRVRAVGPGAAPGAWSQPLTLRVAHHPLWLALSIFAVGAVVFLATVALVLLGSRRSRGERPAVAAPGAGGTDG